METCRSPEWRGQETTPQREGKLAPPTQTSASSSGIAERQLGIRKKNHEQDAHATPEDAASSEVKFFEVA